MFEFLEECFFTGCIFASNEFVVHNVFLFSWLKNSFCQPQFIQIFLFFLRLSLVIVACTYVKQICYFIQKKVIRQVDVLFILGK